jgi:hypothetical protein
MSLHRHFNGHSHPRRGVWGKFLDAATDPQHCRACSPPKSRSAPAPYADDPRFKGVRLAQKGLVYLAVGLWFGFCGLAFWWGRTLPDHAIPADGRTFAFRTHGTVFLTASEHAARDGLIGGFFAALILAVALELWLHRLFPPER